MFLDFHRATLAIKCAGLDDEQLRRPTVPTSSLSLLGLVRHMAEVERTWFRRLFGGEDVPLVWSPDGDYQVAYRVAHADVAAAFAAWHDEVRRAREIEQSVPSLEVTAYYAPWEQDVSLRLVMLHLVHEYARHNGHADLIREAIDGSTGV